MASLGGIDHILNEFIRITKTYGNEELLTEIQMNQITRSVSGELDTVGALAQATNNELTSGATLWDKLYAKARLENDTFHLSLSDTVLHSIFAKDTAERIIAFIFSKYTIIPLAIVCLPWITAISIYPAVHENTWFFAAESVFLCFCYLYLIGMILSCNVPALLLIISGFGM